MRRVTHLGWLLLVLVAATSACARRVPAPAAAPTPPSSTAPAAPSTPAAPPAQRVEDVLPVAQQPLAEDAIGSRSLDDLNRDSPFRPVFFPLDSSDLDDAGRRVAQANSDILKRFASWVVTIEGHGDERGTTEYNLALSERRAVTVKTYLVSLGIAPDRIRIVSYGEEFPFDPGHNDAAWAANRRAQFLITAK